MPRDDNRLTLHGVEQPAKLILRFSGCLDNHRSPSQLAIIAKIANSMNR
jgi:hypothetical protein